jgi:hypothetical protein
MGFAGVKLAWRIANLILVAFAQSVAKRANLLLRIVYTVAADRVDMRIGRNS